MMEYVNAPTMSPRLWRWQGEGVGKVDQTIAVARSYIQRAPTALNSS